MKKRIFLALIILIAFLTIGVISASEINVNDNYTVQDSSSNLLTVDNGGVESDSSNILSIENIDTNVDEKTIGASNETAKKAVIIGALDINLYYKNGTNLIATLSDIDGNKLANQSLILKISGVNYTRTTDINGQASIAINLYPGIYDINVLFKGTDKYLASKITTTCTVIPTIESGNLVKYFRNATQYHAKFLNGDGSPLVNTDVIFNIHGVFYTRTTDSKGYAQLNINLDPGEYIITAFHPITGYQYGSLITVLPTIYGENLTKTYRDSHQFTALFTDGNGNPLKNTDVIYNIHGVFYTRTTNDSGIALLNINLEPGLYILTAYHPIDKGSLGFLISVHSSSIMIPLQNILNSAYNLRTYYNIHGKLPSSVKESAVDIFSIPEFFYLMNKAVQQIGQSNYNDIAVLPGIKGNSQTTENTVYSALLDKDEIISLAGYILNDISKHHQVPSTVPTSAGLLDYEDYVVLLTRTLAYYHDNGELPNYATVITNKEHKVDPGTGPVNVFGLHGKKVYIDADGGSDEKKLDLAKALKAAGWDVTVGITYSNAHYQDYFNVPDNYVLITLFNGFCAGTTRELTTSYIQNLLKAKNVVCVPIWDTAGWTNPQGMAPYRYGDFSGYAAGRAWDDNFSDDDPYIPDVGAFLYQNNVKYCAYPTTEGIVNQFNQGGYFASQK